MTGGSSFLNAFMPVLPWLILVAVFCILAGWAVAVRVRLWNEQRYRIERPRQALQQARDVLTMAISRGVFAGEDQDQAVSAYEAVATALSKEKGQLAK